MASSSDNSDGSKEVSHRIMWNQHSRKRKAMQYRIIAAKECEGMARDMQEVRLVHLSVGWCCSAIHITG